MAAPQANGATATSNKTLIERSFSGVDLSSGLTALRDGYFLKMDNLIPYGPGHLTVMPGQSAKAAVSNVTGLWAFYLAGSARVVMQESDGSVHTCVVGTWAWTTIAAAGATTPNGLHMTIWDATDAQGNAPAIIWCDTAKGYGSWDGTTWKTLTTAINGEALAVYAGRVWIASATTINYTAPDCYNDFTAADYAGSFTITDPTLSGPIVALQATQQWLYIIGAGMMALNNVQVQSVAGSSTLATTYFVTPVSSSVSVSNTRATLVWDNVLFIVTGTGLWAYYGLNGQCVSQQMGDNFSGEQTLFATQVYGKDLIVTSAGYVFMLNDNRWFTMLSDAQTWVASATLRYQGVTAFICTGNTLCQIADDFTSLVQGAWTTKLYDCGNASINKRALKCGVEVYPDELSPVALAANPVTLTQQVVGYVGASGKVSQRFNPVQNQWLPTTVDVTDRYLCMEGLLVAPPGVAISAMMIQFQDSTSWPSKTASPLAVA